MITKYIDIDDDDYPLAKGEQRITPFVHTSYGFELDDRRTKSAACDEALEYAKNIEPIPGKRIILVSALGDFEHYEANKKADAFPENAILGMWPKDVDKSYFSKYFYRIPKQWGYTCFPTKFNEQGIQIGGGNTFYEHRNRTPKHLLGKPIDFTNKQDPRCGYILAAFWNPIMHRVEIIQEVWEQKLPQIVQQIDAGIMPGISMACDIPFDRCYECGNLAVTPADYCEHLNRTSMPRGVIFSSGKGAIMINDFPIFFDSTITAKPAAVEGRTLMKVASEDEVLEIEGEPDIDTDSYESPDGSVKGYSISIRQPKIIIGSANPQVDILQDQRLSEPDFPPSILNFLSGFPLNKVLVYLGLLGIIPKIGEIISMLHRDFSARPFLEGRVAEQLIPPIVKKRIHIISLTPKYASLDFNDDDSSFDIHEFKMVSNVVDSFMSQKSYLVPYYLSRPKTASMINLRDQPNYLSERGKQALVAKILYDPVIRDLIILGTHDPRVLKILEEKGISPEDFDTRILPLYNLDSDDSELIRKTHLRIHDLYAGD